MRGYTWNCIARGYRGSRCLLVLVIAATPVLAQHVPACRENKPPTGDIGIGELQCVAAGCGVNGLSRGRYRHEFSAEPYVWDIDPAGPAAGLLNDGDRIVSINGMLITTAAGGERLANLVPGERLSLRVRRADRVTLVTVVPVLGCNVPSIAVTPHPGRPPRPPR